MSLSSLPTGTISDDGSGSRTYPPDGTKAGHRPPEAAPGDRTADRGPRRDAASLRRENEALRRANAALREKLDSVQRDRQDVVDHYERLLSEVDRQDAVGSTPRGNTARASSTSSETGPLTGRVSAAKRRVSAAKKRISAVTRPAASRIAARVLRAVGLR